MGERDSDRSSGATDDRRYRQCARRQRRQSVDHGDGAVMPADTKRSRDVKDEVASRLAEMPPGALRDWFAVNLRAAIVERGFRLVEEDAPAEEGGIVLHVVDAEKPRSFRRKNRAIFVVGIGEAERYPEEPLKTGYPMLLRTLANLFIMVVREGKQGGPAVYFFTLEQGFYALDYNGDD